jgi:hypothetical protein
MVAREGVSDAEFSLHVETSSEVVERILAEPALTLNDLRVKARAYLWCWSGAKDDCIGILDEKAKTKDKKVVVSILRDLLAT